MPIQNSFYNNKPWYFFNAHMETIIPSLFYKVKGIEYERERLELVDGDFLDVDWIKKGNKRLLVLSHGLEGSSQRHYIQRPAKYFSKKGWDILAWNNRSCSGEMNRLPRFYHHGATEDIATVIERGLEDGYEEVVLMGYSMGGGMQQKYLGERMVDSRIKGAISFSVPCNVKDSAEQLGMKGNQKYERRFIKKLKEKIVEKSKIMELDIAGIEQVKTFPQFDERFTLRLFPGYKDADDFYEKITSDQFLDKITVPLLIVNAENDPMLGEKCYPIELARKSDLIHLEVPKKGGHVGFTDRKDFSYMESAADKFIEEVILKP
ncbi:MAG: alpha/beta fold hydrolase [Cyclobacteriaceae bacterium]